MGEKGPELFKVSNYEDSYLGVASLWSATAASDNSVFAELGMKVKPKRVARLARRMGIKTKLSTNPAMLLGGLEEGVTALEMAYAYSTLANNGTRVSGTLAPGDRGPVAIEEVVGPDGSGIHAENKPVTKQVIPTDVAQTAKDMLSLVVTSGTGKAAQVGDEDIWGKTGTTENYGDAWFAGGNDELTVAVWVGYADKVQAMEYEHGGPVAGGTFPAEIFHDFMTQWVTLRDARRAARNADKESDDTDTYVPPTTVDPNAVPEADQAVPTTPSQPDGKQPDGAPQPDAPTDPPAPEPPVPVEPAPPTEAPPTGGGGTGGGVAPGEP
jgi:penicillin-binding protein 1A